MLRQLLCLISAVAVSAFSNSRSFLATRNSPEIRMSSDYKNALGAQPPLGFWDPLGFLNDADETRFDRLREVEIKHGRISMLAVLGHITTTSGVHLPGDISPGVPFSSIPNGLAALFGDRALPQQVVFLMLIFIGAIDLGFTNYAKNDVETFCINGANRYKWSVAKLNQKRAIELNNGRAAQMGILALMVHEKIDNNPYVINDLLGAPVPFNP